MFAGKIDCEAPKDTPIQSPTTVTVSWCYDNGEIVSLGGLEKLSSHEKCSILKKVVIFRFIWDTPYRQQSKFKKLFP